MEEKFKRVANPFEQPQIGNEWLPPHQRFQPGDENKYWLVDTMHSPEPIYPLEVDTKVTAAASYAIDRTMGYFSLPTGHGNEYKFLNGRNYIRSIDITDPEEIKRRAPKFGEKIGYRFANWDRLWAEAEPKVAKMLDWLESFDFEKEPDLNDPEQMYNLVEYFERIININFRAEEVHFEFIVATTVQTIAYRALAKELVPGTTDEDCSAMLQGFGNKLMETDAAFWKMGELAYSLGIANVVKEAPLGEVISRLEETDNGRKWLEELTKVVHDYGMRQMGGCANICSVSWPEDLTYPISFVRGFMEKIEKGKKLVPKEELVAAREQAVKEFRAKLKTDEDRAKFDESLALMQKIYPWYEDHNFIFEGRLNTLTHLKMVELGRRFVNEGYIDEPYDINYLVLSEVRQLLMELVVKYTQARDYNFIDVRPIIEKRKEDRKKQLEWEFLIVMGVMPTEPPKDPIATLIYGATPENIERASKPVEKPEEIIEFDGMPAAPGVSEGVARVVLEVSGLKDIQPGEILVCGSTNPMWNPVFGKIKGVVTDTGGILSHAGIIAREYGLPAVVGTGYGTRVIKTGDKIRVDGGRGIITKIG